jgi:uncharacterized membrane protein
MDFQRMVEAVGIPVSSGLELFGVLVIGFAFFHAVVRAPLHFIRGQENIFDRLKSYIGKALQLALEFLIAADIIRTVLVDQTREGILSLGLLIVVRTVLSWSITVELEGCWPWQVAGRQKSEIRGQKSE